MKIAGIHKSSLIDYPGKIAAVIFTPGCNFCCPYCHNSQLLQPDNIEKLNNSEIMTFLEERIGVLQGVVITGGEPTLQAGLFNFVTFVKEMGYAVKLDTNGSQPKVLRRLLKEKMIDFVAMDIKAPWFKYDDVAGCGVDAWSIFKSIHAIHDSGIDHQFRTTVAQPLLNETDVDYIQKMVQPSPLLLQVCRTDKVLNPAVLSGEQFGDAQLLEIQKRLHSYKKVAF